MLLDWPTVIFQIINFLILLGLLKRFLYGPIIKVMDERERQVMERLAAAAKSEKAAAQRETDLRHEQEILSQTRDKVQLQARDEVEKWKNDALAHLQAEIDHKREAWVSLLHTEQENFLYKLKKTVARNVFLIARKTLVELADEELEARIIDTFVTKLQQKEDGLGLQLSPSAVQISCITGFSLKEPQKQKLEKALSAYLGRGQQLIFTENIDLGCGIMIVSDGQKVEWNVHRYMDELETAIDTALSSLGREDYGQ